MKHKSLTLLMMAWATFAQASFFPDDGPKAEKGMKLVANPAQMARNEQVLENFRAKMSGLVKARGAELVVMALWDDPRVNALATRKAGIWEIHAYGGLLTHSELDEDELTLVLCHELGHHLGGAPTAARNGWSSCEGQADYWSGKSCATLLRDPEGAALKLTQLYASNGAGSWPDLARSDETRASRTFYGYPAPQCRLDTLLAGFKGMDRPGCWFVTE